MAISNKLIVKSINFLRALNGEYGSEKAMEIWAEMTTLIGDDDLTMAVFKAMLTGGSIGTNIKIIRWDPIVNGKVSAIKALRAYTGISLRDAKLAIERSEQKPLNETFPICPKFTRNSEGEVLDIHYDIIMQDFEETGVTIEFE